MDNQHQKIKGYRDLSEGEIASMNKIKNLASEVEMLINHLETMYPNNPEFQSDKRWLAIGKTDLQKGFMALVRSVAKPTSF